MGGLRILLTARESRQLGWKPNHGAQDDDIITYPHSLASFKRLLTANIISIPPITEYEIKDRSKGDALSKGFAILQLLWFVVQLITRVAKGLAITELELTTAALAGLNSVMYIFWWNKPLDVRCPIIIRTNAVQELLSGNETIQQWTFGDDEFSLRKHLRISTIAYLLNISTRMNKFLRSLPQRLARALPNFTASLRNLLDKTMLLLVALYPAFLEPRLDPGENTASGVYDNTASQISKPCYRTYS